MKKHKMKSKKSVLRRIKITSSGKLLRRRGFGRHLKANKTKGQQHSNKRKVLITGSLKKRVRRALGLR